MSPRPPDFNHMFAPDARHDFSSSRGGRVVTVRIAAGADLRLPTGRLVAGEPGARNDAFVQRVPPGTYPVELIMADYHDPENPHNLLPEVAAARLRVRDEPVASWRMALLAGQDDTELEDDEFFGYPVDGGTGSFGSPELYEAADDDLTPWDVFWPEINQVDDVGVYVDEETGTNLVTFLSGGGDGHYATWIGYTAAGEVACFVTDFRTLTGHSDEDECEYSGAATVSSSGAAMVEPYGGGTGFRFKIRNVEIDGQGDTVHVRGGGSHEVSFEVLHDCRECGNAVNQVIVGLAGQDRAQASVWNGKQRSGGRAKVVNSGTNVAAVAEDNPGPAEWVQVSCDIDVPDGPGTYSVRARYAQAYQGRLMTAEGRAIPQPEYQDVLGWWKVDRPDGPGPESAIGTIIVES